MQPEHLQQIKGYYIEDAKNHFTVIEQYLLNLESIVEDRQEMNRLVCYFKSVNGGAAMLGINSIHKTARRLEDFCRCIELDGYSVKVDQKLKDLFMQVFYGLQELIKQLSQSSSFTDDKATQVMSEIEPVIEALNAHLTLLRKQSFSTSQSDDAIALDLEDDLAALDEELLSLFDDFFLGSSSA